jgi:hypothetical protein
MRIRNRAITTALVALGLATGLVLGTTGPTAAAPARADDAQRVGRPAQEQCDPDQGGDDSGTHVGVGCDDPPPPTTPGGTGGPGGHGGPGIDPAEACAGYPGWADCETVVAMNGIHPDQICGYVVAPDQSLLRYYHPDAPDGYVLLYNICPREGLYYSEDTQAAPGGGGPPPPTPEEVAEGIWAEVQAQLLDPALETWPPPNRSSVLHLPSFVAVTNWQGTQTRHGCDGGVCVDLTATPTLTFDPGDGSGAVTCAAGGTRFDPEGADPEVQARGACAHPYPRRTGVDGRPAAWPGVVSITWDVHWEEDGGANESGDFDPVVLSTALPRVVTEWVSVVTDVAPRGEG